MVMLTKRFAGSLVATKSVTTDDHGRADWPLITLQVLSACARSAPLAFAAFRIAQAAIQRAAAQPRSAHLFRPARHMRCPVAL